MNYEFLIFVIIAVGALFFVVPESLKSVVEDFKFIFSSGSWQEIKKERHDKHFYWSFFIAIFIQTVFTALHLMQFHSFEWYESLFLMTLALLFINYSREGYLQWKRGKDKNGNWRISFSWRDIRFGGYGGFTGSIVASIVASIIF